MPVKDEFYQNVLLLALFCGKIYCDMMTATEKKG